jgi:lysyl-tRNA synthetase, class I
MPRVLPFRTLASVADITAGDEAQMLRILRDMTAPESVASLDQVRPRLDRARGWITEDVAARDRTHVRAEPDTDLLESLAESQRHALRQLLDGLARSWSLDGLTTLLYGIPKLQLGLPADAPATTELKVAQRAWFTLLYQLLVGSHTGPRLPTLLLSLGADRVRSLLTDR